MPLDFVAGSPGVNRGTIARWLLAGGFIAVLLTLVNLGTMGTRSAIARTPLTTETLQPQPAPELDGGIAWLNTSGPIKMKDLKGKIVLLDFWTLCCINCIHIMPDLAKLEKKYPNELVVIGVHSAKFESEKDTKNIKKAILRYEIAHPVVNDADHKIWDRYGVTSWPTMVAIDPEGNVSGSISGEGNLETLDRYISETIKKHKEKKTLDEKPIRFDLVRYREKGDTPLFFPGKILADAASNRLFVSDSTHHRVVVSDLDGKVSDVIGTGAPGFKDGSYAETQFDDPQGLTINGDMLYVADRKNHSIRAVDLKKKQVATIAGNGKQDGEFSNRGRTQPAGAKEIGLNSPWDLLYLNNTIYIAMAGHHQIWTLNLERNELLPFAGNGRENIKDGPLYASNFAQPSGLATDGEFLYVADSEVSAIRKVPLSGQGRVSTIVGEGLFEFGDKDGVGDAARLQHALGVAFYKGKLLVADTYNDKLKWLDPKSRELTSYLGGRKVNTFDEPAGVSIANGKAYVADTNANRIRVVNLTTNDVSTLEFKGLKPPPPQKEWQPPK
ncbi:MAG: thioredoxin-like domain-containing protein [Gemmataceae bacterium]